MVIITVCWSLSKRRGKKEDKNMDFFIEGSWFSLFSEYLIKSSVILSASIVLVFLLRKKSAGLRHLVLSVFLIGLLLLPIFSTVTTGWETKFLPSRQSKDGASAKVDGLIGALDSSSRNLGFFSLATGAHKHTEEVKINSPSILSIFLSRIKPWFGFAALLLWLSGLIFLSLRMVFGLYGTNQLAREGKVLQDSLWKRLLFRFFEAVSLRKKIKLLSHDKTMVPFTWGIFKPIVMMPKESQNWSENQRSSALYHELSHIKRGDYLVMILARISRAVYWFNPLSWIVLGMVKREQEKACDELVLKAGIKPSTYAENLLSIRNSVSGHWNPPAAVLGVMNKSHLNDRLTTILKQRFSIKEVRMRTKVLLSLLAILSISFIGLARPGNSSGGHAEAIFLSDAIATTQVTAHETPADVPDQEKKEQKKKVKKGVKVEEKDKKEQKKDFEKGVKIEVKDKDKDEDEDKTIFVWTTKDGKKGTYEIIIDKDDPKKVILVASPHAKLIKDKSGSWTIKADKMHMSQNRKMIQLDKGAVICIDEEDKDGVKHIKLISPHIQVKKTGKDPEYVTVDVHAVPHVEVHPDVHVVVDTQKYAELIEKIKKKLAKLKDKDLETDVKEVELEGIEKTLEELQKTLEKKYEKSTHFDVHVSPEYSHSYKIRTKDIHIDTDKLKHSVKITDDESMYTLIYTTEIETDQKEAYENAIKKLESKLPENYKIESTFEEGDTMLCVKITNEKEDAFAEDTIKKLIEEFQKELKEIKK
jgi:beta-lactamase regulating signal transducer with metallopeptidase domain